MIPTRTFLSFLLALLFSTLLACGGSGGGGGDNLGSNPTDPTDPADDPPPGDAPDVTIEQLAGTWFGTFDNNQEVRTFEFTVEGANMSDIRLAGADTGLTGSLTKATEVPRAFRFAINNNGNQIVTGMMVADPSGTYVLYVHDNSQVGVLQKGATELPTYAQTDIDGAWAGDTASTTADFTTFTRQDSSAECAPTDPATAPPSSQCTITLDSTTRTASSVVLDDPMGRFAGTFSDDPAAGTPEDVDWRAFLSADKNFAGVLACNDFAGGFPETCDFSAWQRQ